MSFDRLVGSAKRTLTRLFKSDHTINYSRGLVSVDLTGRARFRCGPREVILASGETTVQASVPVLGVDVDELPGGVCLEGDLVVVVGRDGGQFRVGNRISDAHGLTEAVLEEI